MRTYFLAEFSTLGGVLLLVWRSGGQAEVSQARGQAERRDLGQRGSSRSMQTIEVCCTNVSK